MKIKIMKIMKINSWETINNEHFFVALCKKTKFGFFRCYYLQFYYIFFE